MNSLKLFAFILLLAGHSHASQVLYSQVKPQLQRCDKCHDANEADVATLGVAMPFENATKHAGWVADMVERMNRPAGVKGAMPKRPEEWSAADLALVKLWLQEGAPNDQGVSTVPAGKK